jgi:hypothetical protein
MKKMFLLGVFYLVFSGQVFGTVNPLPTYFEGTATVATNGIVTNLDNPTNSPILSFVCRYTLYFGSYKDMSQINEEQFSVNCPGTWNLSNLNGLNL